MKYSKNDIIEMNNENIDKILPIYINEFNNYNTRFINNVLILSDLEILEEIIDNLDLQTIIKIFNNKSTKKMITNVLMRMRIRVMELISNKLFKLCNDNDNITNLLFSKIKKKYINYIDIYENFKYLKKANYKNSLYMLYLYFDFKFVMKKDIFLILHEKYFNSHIKNDFYLLEYFLIKNNDLLESLNLKDEYSKNYVNCYKSKMNLCYNKRLNIDEKYEKELNKILMSKKVFNRLRGK